jgi:predicted XRE-type DNA-binding protein
MTTNKKITEEIIKIPVDPEEEKIFQWVASDECLGSWMPGKTASMTEKTKYQFSQVITRYLVKNNLSESEIANRLGLDKNTTAKLLRGYTENFSLDSLIAYVDKLHLPLQVKITEEGKLVGQHF